jgi:hypothetical protein
MAWEGERRHRVEREGSHLQHLRPRVQVLAGCEPGSIGDANHARRVLLGDVIHAEKTGELDARAQLLEAFAHRRVGRMLVVVDETAG